MTAQAAISTRPAPDLRTFGGRDISVSVQIETMIDAERGVRCGRLVRSRILDVRTGADLGAEERTRLLASDCERIDSVTLARARPMLGSRSGAVIAEVSIVTASSQRARPGLVQAATALRELCGGALIWLLTDLPDRRPAPRLAEAVTFLKCHGRSVFAAVSGPAGAKALRGAPVGGIVMRAPSLPLDTTDAALWLLNAARGLDPSAPATRIACGLSNADALAGLAAAAGFSHVAGPASAPQALAARGGFC